GRRRSGRGCRRRRGRGRRRRSPDRSATAAARREDQQRRDRGALKKAGRGAAAERHDDPSMGGKRRRSLCLLRTYLTLSEFHWLNAPCPAGGRGLAGAGNQDHQTGAIMSADLEAAISAAWDNRAAVSPASEEV